VHEAEDGTTGLQLVERIRPVVVLLDIMMPGELESL
jgi:CheY-like chemotaxis protein